MQKFILPDSFFKSSKPLSKGEKVQETLIRAAIFLIAKKGISGTSTREIAKLSQQNISSIAYYFESKEGLYHAVIDKITEFAGSYFIPIIQDSEAYLTSKQSDVIEVKRILSKILKTFLDVTTNCETMNLSKIILNEQLNPTEAFNRLHEAIFGRMHQLMINLVKTISRKEIDEEMIKIHIHGFIGMVAIFRFGQATIFKETNWQIITEIERNKINTMVNNQLMNWIDSLVESFA